MERWLPVITRGNRTQLGYEISSLGRLRSYWRWGGPHSQLLAKPHLRNPSATKPRGPGKGGTLVAALRVDEGNPVTYPIHELVARAFRGPAPKRGWQIIHLNHDRADNRLVNLKWVSRSEASLHAIRVNPRRPLAKLTPGKVRAIRASKDIARVLAKRYGVQKRAIYDIKWGRTWRDVD